MVSRVFSCNAKSWVGGGNQYRYGGEEFVLLLPETDSQSARDVALGVKRDLAALAIEHPASKVATGCPSTRRADCHDLASIWRWGLGRIGLTNAASEVVIAALNRSSQRRVKSIGWDSKPQGLAWALIESASELA